MKKNWKIYLLFLGIFLSVIFLYNVLADYYIAKGENKAETYYNEKLNEYIIKTQKGYAEKDRLIELAVKEKLDAEDLHHKEIATLETNHLKFQEKVREDFLEINTELFSLKSRNRYLGEENLSLRATLLSFSLSNKELSLALNELEIKTISRYNDIIEATTKVIEEEYINFIKKIDRIKRVRG